MELDVHEKRRRNPNCNVELKSVKVKGIPLNSSKPPIEKPLLEVVSAYLKKASEIGFEGLKKLMKNNGLKPPNREDVFWVITVPAIWTDQARIFMREAAQLAGMTHDQFSQKIGICLEPEGASLDSFLQFKCQTNQKDKKLLIIDLGGGTADMTFHNIATFAKLLGKVTLEELCPPFGGPFGGRRVNSEFDSEFMKPVLGDLRYNKWISTVNRQAFHWKTFEPLKRTFTGTSSIYITFASLREGVDEELTWAEIERNVKSLSSGLPVNEKVEICSNSRLKQIELSAGFVCRLFRPVLEDVKKCIKEKFDAVGQKPDLAFLVGGMGANVYVRDQLEEFLKTLHVELFQPSNGELAIARGAVQFGLDPTSFGLRLARANYGIRCWDKVNKRAIFSSIMKKNQDLKMVAKETSANPLAYSPVEETQSSVAISLYECNNAIEDGEEIRSDCYFITEIVFDIDLSVPFKDRKYLLKISMDGPLINGVVEDPVKQETKYLKWTSR